MESGSRYCCLAAGSMVWCSKTRPSLRVASPLILCAAVTIPVCVSPPCPALRLKFPVSFPSLLLCLFTSSPGCGVLASEGLRCQH